jgi:hypothetical protein
MRDAVSAMTAPAGVSVDRLRKERRDNPPGIGPPGIRLPDIGTLLSDLVLKLASRPPAMVFRGLGNCTRRAEYKA